MKMTEVRAKAKELGLKTGGMSKANLIRAIQDAENNDVCFDTGRSECDQDDCCWREDCLPKTRMKAER